MLKVTNAQVVYDNVIEAVRDVSFEVRDSQIVALLGSNGAGKSTVLKAISSVLYPEDGEVQSGDDLTRVCVVNNIEKMDNFQVGGLMSGVTFGKGNRFSISGVMALQSEPEKKKFKMITKPEVIPVR